MDRTGKLYRIPINRDNIKWYWDHLGKFPVSRIQEAFKDAVETEEHFPSIACIRKFIEKSSTPDTQAKKWPTLEAVKAAEPMGKECISLIQAKLSHKIDAESFYKALLTLHEKYPIKGHEPPLSEFVMKHYRTIESEEPIQPLNFFEAAEMYRLARKERSKSKSSEAPF